MVDTVYIFIPDRIFYGPAARAGSQPTGHLVGHVRWHTHAKTGAPQCTIYITRRSDTKPITQLHSSGPADAATELEQWVGSVRSDDRADEPMNRPLHIAVHFTTQQQPCPVPADKRHQPPQQLRLQALLVPGLMASTRVKLITYSRRVPPVFDAAMRMPAQPSTSEAKAVWSSSSTGRTGGVLRAMCLCTVAAMDRMGAVCPVLRHTAVFQHVQSRSKLLARPNV